MRNFEERPERAAPLRGVRERRWRGRGMVSRVPKPGTRGTHSFVVRLVAGKGVVSRVPKAGTRGTHSFVVRLVVGIGAWYPGSQKRGPGAPVLLW